MSTRARSIGALADALSLAATTLVVGTASAATLPRAAARALGRAATTSVERRDRRGTVASPTCRTVSDGAFAMTRTILRVDGADHVVFTATDLRTGASSTLNAAA